MVPPYPLYSPKAEEQHFEGNSILRLLNVNESEKCLLSQNILKLSCRMVSFRLQNLPSLLWTIQVQQDSCMAS